MLLSSLILGIWIDFSDNTLKFFVLDNFSIIICWDIYIKSDTSSRLWGLIHEMLENLQTDLHIKSYSTKTYPGFW